MMNNMMGGEDFIIAIYNFFKSKNVELSKILLQKAMYSLDFVGENTEFQFEAYTYGPFSRGLGELLADLRGDDKINIDDNTITFPEKSSMNREANQDIAEKTKKILSPFLDKVLEGDTEFGSVELNGTVMFVMDVLGLKNENGKIPVIDEVLEGVKRWKWLRFRDDEIKKAYGRIQKNMWELRGAAQ